MINRSNRSFINNFIFYFNFNIVEVSTLLVVDSTNEKCQITSI